VIVVEVNVRGGVMVVEVIVTEVKVEVVEMNVMKVTM
jgi:hypothetical protein